MKNISEIFYSLQGEGLTAGQPRLFIRLSGCNLKCSFCDTKYHIQGRELNAKDIKLLSKYKSWCFTGGEPLLKQEFIKELMLEFQPDWVEIETNGTVQPSPFLEQTCFFNISPKDKRFQPKQCNPTVNIKLKENNFILKFVYSDKKSQKFIFETLKKVKAYQNMIYVMPECISAKQKKAKEKEVWQFCVKNGFAFGNRLQIDLFGKKKGI